MTNDNQPNWDDDDGNLDGDKVETEGDELNESDDDEDDEDDWDDWDDSEELEEDTEGEDPDNEDNYNRIDGEITESDLGGHWSGDHIYGRDKEMSEFEDAYFSQIRTSLDSDYLPHSYTDDGDDFENV